MVKEKISSISTQYFTAFASVSQATSTTWFGWGELMRNDTLELCPRKYIARGQSEKTARKAIVLTLKDVVFELGIPSDWENPDKVRQILWRYLEFWDEQNKVVNSIKEKGENFNSMLSSEIEVLNNEDKIRLLTASDYAYNNPVRDSYNLNENSARFRLFELINNPDASVKHAYMKHKKRLSYISEKEKERIRLDSISTKYFTAFVSAICVSPDGWIATGELMRKDTSEMCPRRIEARSENEESALDAVTLKLKKVLMNSEVPEDWENPDALRQFLWRYIEFRRGPKGGFLPSDEECEKIEVIFASELKLFNEEDQSRLFTVIKNDCNIEDDCNIQDGVSNFDENYARIRLFDLIKNPTEKVKQAFKKYMLHLKKVKDKRKKMGSDSN